MSSLPILTELHTRFWYDSTLRFREFAVFQNHEGNDAYLVEQSCYLADDEEFWRNVYNTRSKTIVTFECLEVSSSYL